MKLFIYLFIFSVCRIRLAGLKGLQGVVRKTVSDELQVNIWDTTYMDKIVPSFLFNMNEGFDRLVEFDFFYPGSNN